MKRMFSEYDCQKAQATHLASRRDMVRDLMFCAIPNDAAMFATNGKVNFGKMNGLKAMGLIPGAPDLIVWMRGRTIQIENKVRGRHLTPTQKAFGYGLKALGHEYHIITATDPRDATDQLIAILESK